jgi:hypothetical protein
LHPKFSLMDVLLYEKMGKGDSPKAVETKVNK